MEDETKKRKKRISRARQLVSKKRALPPPAPSNADEATNAKIPRLGDGTHSPPVCASVEITHKPLVTSSVSPSPTIVPPDIPFVTVSTSPDVAERQTETHPKESFPGINAHARDEDRMHSPLTAENVPMNNVAVQSGSVLEPRIHTGAIETILDSGDAATNKRRTEQIFASGSAPRNTRRKEVVLESGTVPPPPKIRQRTETVLESGAVDPLPLHRNPQITETVFESGSASLPRRTRQITETLLESGSVAPTNHRGRTETVLDSGSVAPPKSREIIETVLDSGSVVRPRNQERTESVLDSGNTPEPSSARIKSVNGTRREEILDSGPAARKEGYVTPPRPIDRDEDVFDSYANNLPTIRRRVTTEEIINSGSGYPQENKNGSAPGRIAKAANRPLLKMVVAGALETMDERRARNNDLPTSPIPMESDNEYFSATDGPPDAGDNIGTAHPKESIPPTHAVNESLCVAPTVASGDGAGLVNAHNSNGEETALPSELAVKTALSKRQTPQIVPSTVVEDPTPITPAPRVTERRPDEIAGDEYLLQVNRRHANISPEAAEKKKQGEAEMAILMRGIKDAPVKAAPKGDKPSSGRDKPSSEKPKQVENTPREAEVGNIDNIDGEKKKKKDIYRDLSDTKKIKQSWNQWKSVGKDVTPLNRRRRGGGGGRHIQYGNGNRNGNSNGNDNGYNQNGNDYGNPNNWERGYYNKNSNGNGRGNGNKPSNYYGYRRGGPNYEGDTLEDYNYPGDPFYMDSAGNGNSPSSPRNKQDNRGFNNGHGGNKCQPNGTAKFGADKNDRYFSQKYDNGTPQRTPQPRQNPNQIKKKPGEDDSPRIITVQGKKRLEYNPKSNDMDIWRLAAEMGASRENDKDREKTPPPAVVPDNYVSESGLTPEQRLRASPVFPPMRPSPEERARVNGTATLEIRDEITAAVPVVERLPPTPAPAPVTAPPVVPVREERPPAPAPVIAPPAAAAPIRARMAERAGPAVPSPTAKGSGGKSDVITPETKFYRNPGDCRCVLETTNMPHEQYIWAGCREKILVEKVKANLTSNPELYKFDAKNCGSSYTRDFIDGNFDKLNWNALLTNAIREEAKKGNKRISRKRQRDNKRGQWKYEKARKEVNEQYNREQVEAENERIWRNSYENIEAAKKKK